MCVLISLILFLNKKILKIVVLFERNYRLPVFFLDVYVWDLLDIYFVCLLLIVYYFLELIIFYRDVSFHWFKYPWF